MATPRFYNVFVGAETGLLKGVNVTQNTWDNLNHLDSVNKDQEIRSLCWKDGNERELFVATRKGKILLYQDIHIGNFDISNEFNLPIDDIKCNVVSLKVYNDGLISGLDNGIVQVWDEKTQCRNEINTGQNLYCMSLNDDTIATGGKETDLKLWDLNKPNAPIFQAKNVRNDWLNLRVPVWVTGVQFLPNSDKIITSTGHHQIRVYDPGSPQRRPVLDIEFDEHPLTAMALCHSRENHVIVGNTIGKMALIDLRKGKMVHCFKGFAGSIRGIHCHPDLPLIASCGLDRFLRIHDVNSHQLLHKYYLKSRLNCLLLSRKWTPETIEESDSDVGMEHKDAAVDKDIDDELWKTMKVIKTQTIKRGSSQEMVEHIKKKKREIVTQISDAPVLRQKKKKK